MNGHHGIQAHEIKCTSTAREWAIAHSTRQQEREREYHHRIKSLEDDRNEKRRREAWIVAIASAVGASGAASLLQFLT